MLRQYFITYFSLSFFLLNFSYSNTLGELKICALRMSFPIDDDLSTSGDGGFLMSSEGIDCGTLTIDPPSRPALLFIPDKGCI